MAAAPLAAALTAAGSLCRCIVMLDCWFAGYSDDKDWTGPKEPNDPDQQEVLHPLSLSTPFSSV